MLVNLALIPFSRYANEKARNAFRYGLAATLICTEITYNVWRAVVGIWSIQENLLFHLCSLLIFLSAILLVTKNYTLYEIVYFLGIAGATQALLTPDVAIYGYPHLRFFTAFITHGAIVTTAIYMTVVEGFRPTWRSIGRVLAGLAVYAVAIFGLNLLIGSNYLFIARKPDVPTLLDMLGPWPFYILPLVGIAVVLFLILYLPFAIKDWRGARTKQMVVES